MSNPPMQNKTEMYKNMPSEELANTVTNLVWKCARQMPAHFCSNGDRLQSFCVDFDDIDAGDEYQMASASYVWVGEHIKPEDNLTESQYLTIVRCGEDLMISSYIIKKLGRIEILEKVVTELTDKNKGCWPDDFEIPRIFETESAKSWFDFCKSYGVQVAQGKYI